MTTWILVGNAANAALYESKNVRMGDYHLIKQFEHPESREKGMDLISDRPGHYQTDHKARSAYEQTDPKEVEAETFMIELANEVMAGCNLHTYDHLVLVLPSHLYGTFKKHLTCKAPELKIDHVDKDYTALKQNELEEQVKNHLFF